MQVDVGRALSGGCLRPRPGFEKICRRRSANRAECHFWREFVPLGLESFPRFPGPVTGRVGPAGGGRTGPRGELLVTVLRAVGTAQPVVAPLRGSKRRFTLRRCGRQAAAGRKDPLGRSQTGAPGAPGKAGLPRGAASGECARRGPLVVPGPVPLPDSTHP